jgi:hypothetical protein
VGVRGVRSIWIGLVITVAAGCASAGSMTGQISNPAGGPAQPVTLSYTPNRSGDSGYLSITLPNGESFNGPYARVGSPAAAGPAFDIDFSVVDWGQSADQWTFDQTETNKVVALLQGSRGRKIRCRFTLLYAAGGMRDGGTGECQVTTGEKIDIRF